MNTNKFLRLVATVVACTVVGLADSRGMMFYYDTYVIFDSGSGSTYYDALSDGGDPNWNGANFSYNMLGGTLTLKGGDVYAYRDDNGNYWNGNNTQTLNYAVYQTGSSPSFTGYQILAGGSGGSASFQGGNNWRAVNSTGSVNIGNLVTSSGNNWKIAVYFSGNASYNDGGGSQQYFDMGVDSNGGANYVANVNAFYGATTTGTQSAAFSGTGYFNFNGNGQTYTLDQANSYTGETQIDAGTVAVTGSLNSASMIYVGSGANSSDAALSLSGTTTLANNIQVNVSGGSGTRDIIKADATSQIASGNITNNRNSTINVTNAGGNLNLSGVLSGTSSITKVGSGTLVLSGGAANTISGGLTVNAGEVVFNKNANTAAVGSSVTVGAGGTLTASAANQFGGNALDLDGTLNLGGNNQNLALFNAGTGTINLGGATLTNNNGNVDTFSGAINGSGNLVKAGNGTLILSAGSGFTGTTTVSTGALEVQNATGLGTTDGATTVADGAALKLYNGSSMTVAENLNISGTGVNGANGALYNVGGDNTVSGTITLGANTRIGATAGSLSVGAVSGGNNVLFVGGAANTTISGILSGAGNSQNGTTTSLFKDGAGVLTLSGNNSYSGDTRLAQGTLTVASGGSLGNGTSDVFLSNSTTLNINTDVTVASIREATNNVAGGVIAIGSGATLTVNGANKGNLFQNSISGEGGLTLNASGNTVLGLYGTQSYTGTTTVSGGKLTTAVGLSTAAVSVSGGEFATTADNVLGDSVSVTIDGGTFSAGGSDTVGALSGSGGTLTLANGKTFTSSFDGTASTFAGTISGAGVFAKSGTGTLTLSGSNNYSGGTFLYGGTLDADNNYAFGTGSVAVYSNTTLDLLSHNITNQIINNGGTISSAGVLSDVDAEAGETTISGNGSTVTQAAGTATVTVAANDVVVSSVGGSAQVNIAGTGANVGTVSGGTVTLSNGATDAAISSASAGTVNANAAGVRVGTISNAAVVNVRGNNGRVATLAGGTLNADAAGLVITNKTGGNIAVSNGVTVGLRSGNSSGVISGAGGIAKQGATTLTLSGTNTYTGTTSVEQGRLVVANGGSLASTNTTVTNSTLTVNGTISGVVTASSGGIVGGSGTVGTLNINGGGVFGPGNSAGTTTATNGASWSQGGSYAWEIFDLAGPSGTGWDLLDVTGGSLNLNGITTTGGFTINLITLQSDNTTQGALSGFDPTATYTNWMIASAPTITGFVASEFNLNSSLFVGATGTFGIEQRSITGGEGLFVTYTAGSAPVPEPGTWAAAALLAGAAAYVRLRRRKEVEPKA